MAMLRQVAKFTGWEISRTCYDLKVWLRHLSVNNTHICRSAQTWSDSAQHERALAWRSRRDSEAQGQCEDAKVLPELKEKPGEALRATGRGMDLSALEVITAQVNREQGNKPGVLGIHAFKEIGGAAREMWGRDPREHKSEVDVLIAGRAAQQRSGAGSGPHAQRLDGQVAYGVAELAVEMGVSATQPAAQGQGQGQTAPTTHKKLVVQASERVHCVPFQSGTCTGTSNHKKPIVLESARVHCVPFQNGTCTGTSTARCPQNKTHVIVKCRRPYSPGGKCFLDAACHFAHI
jgi:hypothetical protein